MALAQHARRTPARATIETPYSADHERSLHARMDKGVMPKGLTALLRWYSQGWDMEVPTALHKSEVWRDHGIDAQGGSKLGAPAHSDPFRRYLENMAGEIDVDGYYLRPMHAALSRLGRGDPFMARTLFAVAMCGYDWRGVADRMHYADAFMRVYIEEALRRLWREYADRALRLE